MDKCHSDVLPPRHTLFNTVLVKLILRVILLSVLCQVNVLWEGGKGGGDSHLSCSLSMSETVKMISQDQTLPVQAKVDVKAVK